MTTKFTATDLRTINEFGAAMCLWALEQNEVYGEGPWMVGGNDYRVGNRLINAGRKLKQRNNA